MTHYFLCSAWEPLLLYYTCIYIDIRVAIMYLNWIDTQRERGTVYSIYIYTDINCQLLASTNVGLGLRWREQDIAGTGHQGEGEPEANSADSESGIKWDQVGMISGWHEIHMWCFLCLLQEARCNILGPKYVLLIGRFFLAPWFPTWVMVMCYIDSCSVAQVHRQLYRECNGDYAQIAAMHWAQLPHVVFSYCVSKWWSLMTIESVHHWSLGR